MEQPSECTMRYDRGTLLKLRQIAKVMDLAPSKPSNESSKGKRGRKMAERPIKSVAYRALWFPLLLFCKVKIKFLTRRSLVVQIGNW